MLQCTTSRNALGAPGIWDWNAFDQSEADMTIDRYSDFPEPDLSPERIRQYVQEGRRLQSEAFTATVHGIFRRLGAIRSGRADGLTSGHRTRTA